MAAGKMDGVRVLVQGSMALLGAQMTESAETLREINQEDIKTAAE